MKTIHVDFSSACGPIKPMNAVNNGPTGMSERGTSNFLDYKALEIPYARNHDASFYYGYGGEHTVDVHRIFRNFDDGFHMRAECGKRLLNRLLITDICKYFFKNG